MWSNPTSVVGGVSQLDKGYTHRIRCLCEGHVLGSNIACNVFPRSRSDSVGMADICSTIYRYR